MQRKSGQKCSGIILLAEGVPDGQTGGVRDSQGEMGDKILRAGGAT